MAFKSIRSLPESALVLFPGALGDFICFLPTLVGLRVRHHGRLAVVAKPTLLQLIEPSEVTGISIDRREIADLFGTGEQLGPESAALFGGFEQVYSWTGAGDPDFAGRLGALTRGFVNVYPFRAMQMGEHAADYYARCAGVTPTSTAASWITDDAQWFAAFQRTHGLNDFAVVHAGSGAARKNWHGFPEVVHWCQQRHTVILVRGPVESDAADNHAYGADIVVDGLALSQIAALLRRTRLYIGNDSGVSHLAAAVGATIVALFGPTDPRVWAPRGRRVHILHAPNPCMRCGPEVFCVHRLPASAVIEALGAFNKDAIAHPSEVVGGRRSH